MTCFCIGVFHFQHNCFALRDFFDVGEHWKGHLAVLYLWPPVGASIGASVGGSGRRQKLSVVASVGASVGLISMH